MNNRWSDLVVPVRLFKCGHEMTPGNTQFNRGYPRCAICHRARCTAWRRKQGIKARK